MKITFARSVFWGSVSRFVRSLCVTVFIFFSSVSPSVASQQEAQTGSVLNILLLAVIAYFLVKMFRRRRGGGDHSNQNDYQKKHDMRTQQVHKDINRHDVARQIWQQLSSADLPDEVPSIDTLSTDFDEREFLEGAKLFFARFQEAEDTNDFEDLKMYLSDAVYSDVKNNVAQDGVARSEIMLLDARLAEVFDKNDRTFASVYYDAQIRKGVSGDQPIHKRVVWEFSRSNVGAGSLWILEKINKVDQ